MANRKSELWPRIIEVLKDNRRSYNYEELADLLGAHPRGVGAAMRAICRRGQHEYCPRVVDKNTGCPRGDCPEAR